MWNDFCYDQGMFYQNINDNTHLQYRTCSFEANLVIDKAFFVLNPMTRAKEDFI